MASGASAALRGLALPLIVSPMFLVSTPRLVIETCRAGAVGTFPALNQRTTDGYEQWLSEVERGLALASHPAAAPPPPAPAPYGVNLIVHRTNPRLEADLAVTVKKKVPLVITSLGAVREVVDAVHSYGGLVFHDVVSVRHAQKAQEAGVDGLIAVCAGAGGHAGTTSPFALVAEIRKFFKKTLVLAGCVSSGGDVAAAIAMGADYAYSGTRFIATREAEASTKYKQMICDAASSDIIYTPNISGIPANFLRQSIVDAGMDPDALPPKTTIDLGAELTASKAWKDIWSAGQGSAAVSDIPTTRELLQRFKQEYDEAVKRVAARV